MPFFAQWRGGQPAKPGIAVHNVGGVKVFHSKNQRDEECRDYPKGAGGGFERPPDHDSPMAAGQMLQHQNTQRTERQSQNQQKRGEIGTEKIFRFGDPPNDGHDQSESAHTQRALLQSPDAFRRFIFLRGHSLAPPEDSPPLSSFCRKLCGSSLTFALRLSCSAKVSELPQSLR